jgi:hypothetical protein
VTPHGHHDQVAAGKPFPHRRFVAGMAGLDPAIHGVKLPPALIRVYPGAARA